MNNYLKLYHINIICYRIKQAMRHIFLGQTLLSTYMMTETHRNRITETTYYYNLKYRKINVRFYVDKYFKLVLAVVDGLRRMHMA